jgi:hypothetical protein
MVAFELSWVDAGAATCSLAGNLGLSPIHERGTPEQRDTYMRRAVPPQPGEDRAIWRGAFSLTEPLPYVGVETGLLGGKVRVAEWEDGKEPVLQVDKRGRFITNMGFANFVTAAVDSADPRIKGSCMVILEETDPGIFDRGVPTKKLVHQLSSTCDRFSLKVAASQIIGGYDRAAHHPELDPRQSSSRIPSHACGRPDRSGSSAVGGHPLPTHRFRGETARGRPVRSVCRQGRRAPRLSDIWAAGEAAASPVSTRAADERRARTEKDAIRETQTARRPARQGLRPRPARLVKEVGGRRRVSTDDPLVKFVLLDRSTCSARRPSCGTPATAPT